MIDPVFINIVSISLCLLLVTSALDKLRHPEEFLQVLTAYGVLPGFALRTSSRLIPLLEMLLGIGLHLPAAKLSAVGVAALLSLYGAAMFANIRRGNLSLDCGCQFGSSRQSISIALVYRNLALAGTALLLLLPDAQRHLGAFDYAVVTIGGMAAVLLYVTTNTLISNATNYREVLS